jgi:sugar O-acyltransferase (sialic acid O-acetyltransferase NeuD family)
MRIVMVGAGGHGAVVADILLRMGDAGAPLEPVGLVDDQWQECDAILDLPIIPGGIDALLAGGYDAAVVAIGDNRVRRRLCERLTRAGVSLPPLRHPSSSIARDVTLGAGVVVCAGAVVNPGSRIGCGVIVNTHASVDHHNSIGAFTHVAPGVHLGGNVTIGEQTLVGIGASVIPGRCIGSRVIIGAGSVVIRDVPHDAVAVGVPARVRDARLAAVRAR